MKLIKIMNQIEAISSGNPESCKECPNFKNKPEGEGCGLDVCLNQINKLIAQVNQSKIVPKMAEHVYADAGFMGYEYYEEDRMPSPEFYREKEKLEQHFMIFKSYN